MRRRQEYFRISQRKRRYDRETGKFIINIAYETAAKITPRTVEVAEGFGLGLDQTERFVLYDNVELKISLDPPDIVYVTGDSGSGKSILLKALEQDIKQDLQLQTVNINRIRPRRGVPLIETVGKTVKQGMELLNRVGLGDAFLYLRTYEQLSDGQRFRYKVAKMLESEARFWVFDEFCSTLDRDTAKIVSFNLQKLARSEGKCVLAATTHTDLAEDLKPSVHVHKRFGKEITVNYYPNKPTEECCLIKEMRIEEGTTKDWRELAVFHYRSHRIAAPRKIFCLKRGEELCGVIVYCYPPSTSFGRRLTLPKMGMKELNEKLSTISRIVVHPKYRTVGLGAKLVKETLSLADTEYVEMSAVMAKYNPFAEKAGMKKVAEQKPPKEALGILEVLRGLGFDDQLLGSERHVLEKLQILSEQEIERIKQAFVKYSHPRFMKAFSYHLPFGAKQTYRGEIARLSLEKLAHLIKICSFLMQTKVYLFWQSSYRFKNPDVLYIMPLSR